MNVGLLEIELSEFWAAKKQHMSTSTTFQPFPLHSFLTQPPLPSTGMSKYSANKALGVVHCVGPDYQQPHTGHCCMMRIINIHFLSTVICRLMTGIWSKKCSIRRLCHCAKTIECTYTNLRHT